MSQTLINCLADIFLLLSSRPVGLTLIFAIIWKVYDVSGALLPYVLVLLIITLFLSLRWGLYWLALRARRPPTSRKDGV